MSEDQKGSAPDPDAEPGAASDSADADASAEADGAAAPEGRRAGKAGQSEAGQSEAGQSEAGQSEAGQSEAGQRRAKRAKAPWWEMPVLVLVALTVAILVKTFLFQPFYIPSQSMEPTLHGCAGCPGDRVLVNKPAYYLSDPSPGDIVVFRAPVSWDDEVQYRAEHNAVVGAVRWFGQLVGVVPPDEKDLIKRVIAVGGQSVKCCDEQGRVQISENGEDGPWRPLDEPYLRAAGSPSPTAPFGPVTVPQGRLWVMGDNRGDSADSRAHCDRGSPGADNAGGCDPVRSTVDVDAVIGKAVLIVWPPSRWRTLGTPETFAAATGSALPLAAGALAAVPLGLVLRRSRRP
jgi:signal peptidase I